MRLVYLAESIIPSRAANSVHVMKMCQAFAQNGHDVTLIVPQKPNIEPGVDDVFSFYDVDRCFEIQRVAWFPIKGKVQLYGVMSSGAAARVNPDLVYGRFLSGCAMSAFRGLPVVYEAHAPVRDLGRIAHFLFRKMIRRLNYRATVVISKALRDYYVKTYGILGDRVFVAHDGANPVDHTIEPIQLNDGSGEIHVGYIGGLYAGKGMELIAEIAPRCPWAQFHIVGGTTDDIQKWRDVLRDTANVTFHGFQPPSETERYRATFDVVLAPYQKHVLGHGDRGEIGQWMSPLKLFEYMASGKAIVCSDLPVLREVLSHEQNAMLCPADDPEAWRVALERLRNDPALRERLGRQAQEDFKAHYTWRERARRLIEIIAG